MPRKIIGAKAPEIAIMEPTERSIPAVPMTNVMPTATITMVQTCVRFTLSVCQLTKCGVKNRLNKISAKRATSVPRRRRWFNQGHAAGRVRTLAGRTLVTVVRFIWGHQSDSKPARKRANFFWNHRGPVLVWRKSGCLINHLQSDRLFDLPSGVGADSQ